MVNGSRPSYGESGRGGDAMARMVELNKGPMVGGPMDGEEHSVFACPPGGAGGVSPERVGMCRVFSVRFPGGAVYGWDAASGSWRYAGPSPDGGGAFGALLRIFRAGGEPDDEE